jgi:hypothetical protein
VLSGSLQNRHYLHPASWRYVRIRIDPFGGYSGASSERNMHHTRYFTVILHTSGAREFT